MIPTLVLHETFSRLDQADNIHPEDLRSLPDSQMQIWNVPGMIARAGWTATDYAAFRAARHNQDLFLRAFRGAGGRILSPQTPGSATQAKHSRRSWRRGILCSDLVIVETLRAGDKTSARSSAYSVTSPPGGSQCHQCTKPMPDAACLPVALKKSP